MRVYSDLPREWPMARLCISYRQVNRYIRTVVWRRVAEQGLKGTHFGRIPGEVKTALTDDLLQISNALAEPLANLFAFLSQGHPQCAFADKKHLALYANPEFWQYGLLAFCSECCASNIEQATEAKANPANLAGPPNCPESEVNTLTLTQTVIMSFARGMTHGQQELPINDMFVYFPVQALPSLVQSITANDFQPAPLEKGLGYRTGKGQVEDNPFLVVGAYRKDIKYEGNPTMPYTPWAARAFASRALDPSLEQSMSFPSLPKVLLRVEVPLWMDLSKARDPPPNTNVSESEADSGITGTVNCRQSMRNRCP